MQADCFSWKAESFQLASNNKQASCWFVMPLLEGFSTWSPNCRESQVNEAGLKFWIGKSCRFFFFFLFW